MDFALYQPTELEERINGLYQRNLIHYPSDLNIDMLSCLFRVQVRYHEHPPEAFWDDDFGLIYLDSSGDDAQQREDFFHELGHVYQHVGNQATMPELFVELQEWQADHFKYYAAMPISLIRNLRIPNHENEALHFLIDEFKVSEEFVIARLEQICRRAYSKSLSRNFYSNYDEPKPSFNIVSHSAETMKLFGKLSWYSAQKGKKINWLGN